MSSLVVSESYAGLQAQALGLAERAGLTPRIAMLTPRRPWRWLPTAVWPSAGMATGFTAPRESLVIGCGGMAARVIAELRQPMRQVVQVQHPRMDPGHFDLVVAARHDRLSGPNVIVTRTALHRVTQERLAAERLAWADRLAHLPRPLVTVLVGGSNGRFRLGKFEGERLAAQLADIMRLDGAGVAVTPSRRTDPAVRAALARELAPLGGWVWDMQGDNPYFGLLAWADAIVVTMDSVSMVSEAAATAAPVLVAGLPGRSRRIGSFLDGLRADGRLRDFAGRLEMWQTSPLDDTQEAADTMRRRLGF